LEFVESGHRGEPQAGEGSFYHRTGLEATTIDWNQGTQDVYNLVRGQADPFVNAWTLHDGERLFVKAAALPTRSYCGTPGHIMPAADGGVAVPCSARRVPTVEALILLRYRPRTGPCTRRVTTSCGSAGRCGDPGFSACDALSSRAPQH
jgi:methionyl-tRNA formyltransferase